MSRGFAWRAFVLGTVCVMALGSGGAVLAAEPEDDAAEAKPEAPQKSGESTPKPASDGTPTKVVPKAEPPAPAEGDDEELDPDEDESVFGEAPPAAKTPDKPAVDKPTSAKPAADAADADDEESVFTEDGAGPGILPNELIPDRLAIGGQLYMRLSGTVTDQGSPGEQRLSMPNLLDLYLDARPVDRLRAYARARLTYDPTIGEDSIDLLGNPVVGEPLQVVLDQLWLKTDIARTVYITLGKQRIKWGESRIWNPTDFLNNTRRDPLAFFDERTGVNLLKLHFPIEALDWNIYFIGILDGVNQWDRAGGAARVEMVIGPTEWSVSFAAGNNMTTAIGLGVSAPIWEFDFAAELAITNESGRVKYLTPFSSTFTQWANRVSANPTAEDVACLLAAEAGGELDLNSIVGCIKPPTETLDSWQARVSAGLTYALRYNDDDLMLFGLEYFYNSTGYSDIDRYPWLLATGEFEPFYLGEHYAGFVWSVPGPGTWDDVSFTASTLGNLSDLSFIQRLDFSATFFTRLRLEVYAQFHFGKPGGELRFELDAPQLPEQLQQEGQSSTLIPQPVFDWGVNLRLAI